MRNKGIQTKHITDRMVCAAYATSMAQRGNGRTWNDYDYPYKHLMRGTGACFKVCYAAMQRADDRGLVDCGVSLRTGWLTDAGKALLVEGVRLQLAADATVPAPCNPGSDPSSKT